MIHTWKNKYESRYSIKKRSGEYEGWQQEHSNAKRGTLDKTTNNSRYQNNIKETSSRRNHFTRRNTTE